MPRAGAEAAGAACALAGRRIREPPLRQREDQVPDDGSFTIRFAE
jgi:hypothetical protein